jgi:hypothetical protein
MKTLDEIQTEIADRTATISASDATAQLSPDTRKLAENILENLTGVSAEWLGNATPICESLLAKAQDESLTDDDFIKAVQAASAAMPSLFDKLNWRSLATAIEKANGAAMVNGIAARLRDFNISQA